MKENVKRKCSKTDEMESFVRQIILILVFATSARISSYSIIRNNENIVLETNLKYLFIFHLCEMHNESNTIQS